MAIGFPLAWPITPRTGQGFTPTELDLNVASSSKSGGQSLSGIEQLKVSPAARWEGKFRMPSMLPEEILVWRGFLASLQGRLGTFLLPAFEYGRQPWPRDANGRVLSPDVVGTANATIGVPVAAPAALNATQVVVKPVYAGPILPGHRFSVGAQLFEIQLVTANNDGTLALSVRPWVRSAFGPGTVAEFANPTVKVRFKTDDEGALRFTSHRTANPVFSVVEAF